MKIKLRKNTNFISDFFLNAVSQNIWVLGILILKESILANSDSYLL